MDDRVVGGAPVAGQARRRLRRSWPLKVYVVGSSCSWSPLPGPTSPTNGTPRGNDAQRVARADAQFAADTAARSIGASIELVRTTVTTTAATHGLAAVLAGPISCTLTFGKSESLSAGHLDVVARTAPWGAAR